MSHARMPALVWHSLALRTVPDRRKSSMYICWKHNLGISAKYNKNETEILWEDWHVPRCTDTNYTAWKSRPCDQTFENLNDMKNMTNICYYNFLKLYFMNSSNKVHAGSSSALVL